MKESDTHLFIEAASLIEKGQKYIIKQPLSQKESMLQIYDFNFYNVVDHLEIREEKLFLLYPE